METFGQFNAASFAEILIEIGKQTYLLRSDVQTEKYKLEREEKERKDTLDELAKTKELARKQDSFLRINAEKREIAEKSHGEHVANLNRAIDSLKKQNEANVNKLEKSVKALDELRKEYKELKKFRNAGSRKD